MGFRFTTFAKGRGGRTGFRVGAFGEKTFKFLDDEGKRKLKRFIELSNEIFERIVALNPVADEPYYDLDIHGNPPRELRFPGRSKAGWVIAFESTSKGVKVKITNPVYYTVYLEYGWSSKAPQGMIRITLRDFRDRLRNL